jgi:hypothetical protein
MSWEIARLGAIGDRVLEIKVYEGAWQSSLRACSSNGVDSICKIHTGCSGKIPFRDDGCGCDNDPSDEPEDQKSDTCRHLYLRDHEPSI